MGEGYVLKKKYLCLDRKCAFACFITRKNVFTCFIARKNVLINIIYKQGRDTKI